MQYAVEFKREQLRIVLEVVLVVLLVRILQILMGNFYYLWINFPAKNLPALLSCSL